MARASWARPCLKSSWARCTPEDVEGADEAAAGPFFARHSPRRSAGERSHLLAKMGRHLVVHVREEGFRLGWSRTLRFLNGPGNLVSDVLFEPRVASFVPPSRAFQISPEPGDRVARAPERHLGFVAVPRGIVARRMRADAIRDGLDQCGPEPLPRVPRRVAGRSIDG